MAKKLTLKQLAGNGTTVHWYKGLVPARGMVVQIPGDDFLARAGLPRNKDTDLFIRHLRHELTHMLHPPARAHKAAEQLDLPLLATLAVLGVLLPIDLRPIQGIDKLGVIQRPADPGNDPGFRFAAEPFETVFTDLEKRNTGLMLCQLVQVVDRRFALPVDNDNTQRFGLLQWYRPLPGVGGINFFTDEFQDDAKIVTTLFVVNNKKNSDSLGHRTSSLEGQALNDRTMNNSSRDCHAFKTLSPLESIL